MLADREDRLKFVLGPAGCGKTLFANFLLHTLREVQAEDPKLVGWRFIRLDVQYTHTLPQFSKLLFQVPTQAPAGNTGWRAQLLMHPCPVGFSSLLQQASVGWLDSACL